MTSIFKSNLKARLWDYKIDANSRVHTETNKFIKGLSSLINKYSYLKW